MIERWEGRGESAGRGRSKSINCGRKGWQGAKRRGRRVGGAGEHERVEKRGGREGWN